MNTLKLLIRRKLHRQGNIFDGQLEIRFSVLRYFLVWRKILGQKKNLTQREIFNLRKTKSFFSCVC